MAMTFEGTQRGAAEDSTGKEEKQWTMNEAIGEIHRLEQQVQATEPVDSERNAFSLIRSDLINGKLTPNEAVAKAQAVVDSMQSYH